MSITFRAKHKSGFWVEAPLTPFTFPGGEAHIKMAEGIYLDDYTHYMADVRGHDPQDLFMLSMWAQVVHKIPGAKMTVILPYLPAARADRGDARAHHRRGVGGAHPHPGPRRSEVVTGTPDVHFVHNRDALGVGWKSRPAVARRDAPRYNGRH